MSSKEWGEAHSREARSMMLRHASVLVIRGHDDLRAIEVAGETWTGTEDRFRRGLSFVDGFGSDTKIDAAVCRVYALADDPPRLVRETSWGITNRDTEYTAMGEPIARMIAKERGQRVIRITRIRRAT